jgi:hypothetical protein
LAAPFSFQRKAIHRLSGDQVGDAGAVPMMLGSCATRSTVRPLELVAPAVCAVAGAVAARMPVTIRTAGTMRISAITITPRFHLAIDRSSEPTG